jgi:hypothetical protein
MAISVADWSFTSGGPVNAIQPTDTADWTGLYVSVQALVESTGERITQIIIEIRNAANTSTVASYTYSPISSTQFMANISHAGLVPGTVYTLRIRAAGTVSALGVIATRQFRYALGEVTYPVSLGTDPSGLALAVTLVNANQDNYAIHYAPADGPLAGDVTGAFSTSPPTSFPVPAYVHIRVRVQNLTKFARMELAWRAS